MSDAFWAKVAVGEPGECWPWLGAQSRGRGRFRFEGRMRTAPRVAKSLADGIPLPPPELMACHTCDNPICVNPGHLYWGSAATNYQDAVERGQIAAGPLGARPLISAEIAREIVEEYAGGGVTQAQLAERYGVRRPTVSTWVGGRRPGIGVPASTNPGQWHRSQPCGTYGGYSKHRRRGEPACEECLAARRQRTRDDRARWRAAAAS